MIENYLNILSNNGNLKEYVDIGPIMGAFIFVACPAIAFGLGVNIYEIYQSLKNKNLIWVDKVKRENKLEKILKVS